MHRNVACVLSGTGLALTVRMPSPSAPSPPPTPPPTDAPPQHKARVIGLGERQRSPCTGSQREAADPREASGRGPCLPRCLPQTTESPAEPRAFLGGQGTPPLGPLGPELTPPPSQVYAMLLSSFLWFAIRSGGSLDRKGKYTLSRR